MNYLRGCVADSRDLCQVIYNEMDDCDRQVWQLLMFPNILSCNRQVLNIFIDNDQLSLLEWAHNTDNLVADALYIYNRAWDKGMIRILQWVLGAGMGITFHFRKMPPCLETLKWIVITHGTPINALWVDRYIRRQCKEELLWIKSFWPKWTDDHEIDCCFFVEGWI